jgi:hypothetical protein
MNEKQVRSFLKNLTEQKAPAAEINLWPAIEANLLEIPLQTSKLIKSRGTKMNTRQPSIPRLAATALMAVLLAGVLFLTVTSQGQAIAQNVLRLFTRTESNLMPGTNKTAHTWVEQTPGVAVATPTPYSTPQGPAFETVCGSFQSPNCTIEDIRELVSFPVYGLVDLPDGFDFLGATGGPEEVILFYSSQTLGDRLIINQAPVTGNQYPVAWNVGADADIQRLTIGLVAGEYVKGSYDGNLNPPVWNGDLDVQTLRWINQGIAFSMQVTGKESRIDREGVVDLAASLTDGPLATSTRRQPGTATSTPEPFDFHPVYPLTLSEAEQQAGFAVLLPSRLPEALSFVGAAYDEKTKSVQLFYGYNRPDMPELTDGLSIREILLPEYGPCTLCSFEIGQYDGQPENATRWVGENATIETVQIDGATAHYVEGVWQGTNCCGWVWEPDPYMKQLRWQVNGKAFELSYMGMAIEKEDLITIANSLQ